MKTIDGATRLQAEIRTERLRTWVGMDRAKTHERAGLEIDDTVLPAPVPQNGEPSGAVVEDLQVRPLPGAGETAYINSVAYSRIHWKHFHKVGEYKGVKLLAVWTHGPGQMFTKKPINTLADFQNLKIRTGGGISAEVISALGGSPFFKPAPESYELLNSGVADGVFFPLWQIWLKGSPSTIEIELEE
mgnify:CR=1 FL=1